MSVQPLTAWRLIFEDLWPGELKMLPRYIEAAEAGRARTFVKNAHYEVGVAVLVRGCAIRGDVCTMVPAVNALLREQADHASVQGTLLWADMQCCDLACQLQCVGCDGLEPNLLASMGDWLGKVAVARSDDYVSEYWKKGFIGLALDRRDVYYPIAGYNLDGAIPFTAGETFELNIQGLLGHLAGAVENGATLDDVQPAWRDLLRCVDDLENARMLCRGGLIWIGRVVYHRVGGLPLGSIADRLRDDVVDMFG